MDSNKPLTRSKDDFGEIINKIKSDSAVGIDVQFTHAVIIEYLMRLEKRLDDIEAKITLK